MSTTPNPPAELLRLKRYEFQSYDGGYYSDHEIVEHSDGEYVRYDDVVAAWNKRSDQRSDQRAGAGEWVSVRDREPESSGNVLAYIPAVDGHGSVVLPAFYDASPDERNFAALSPYTYRGAGCITHWRPLPGGPTQERGDGEAT